jgi:hypothetical protein
MNAYKIYFKIYLKIIAITTIAVVVKYVLIQHELNILSTGNLLNSMIAGTIFVFGIILSTVFSEFREAHRLPGELGNHLESLFEDVQSTPDQNLKLQYKNEYLMLLRNLYHDLNIWSKKDKPSKEVFKSINEIAHYINSFEGKLPPNYIARMRTELFNVRKIFIRIDYTRDVRVSGYLEMTSIVFAISTIFTMMCTKFENDVTGLWSVGLLSLFFCTIYVVSQTLDRPFENNLINFKAIDQVIKNI